MARVDIKINSKLHKLVQAVAKDQGLTPDDIIQNAILKQCCSPSDQQKFLDSLQSSANRISSSFDISLNCLRIKSFRCIFCDGEAFEVPILKMGSQLIDVNQFEVLTYNGASSSKFESCNYSMLETFSCPHCGFTSKFEGHFLSKNFKGDWECKLDPSANVKKSVAASSEQRLELLSEASTDYCSERRNTEDAILSNELAIQSAQAILDGSIDSRKTGWRYLIATYHLQLYEFYRQKHDKIEQKNNLMIAVKELTTAHKTGLTGEAMYKTAYILTVFAIKRKDIQSARSMWGFLNKALEGTTGSEKTMVNKYLPRVKAMYQDYALALRKEKEASE